jgi:hypothetical protein
MKYYCLFVIVIQAFLVGMLSADYKCHLGGFNDRCCENDG